MHMHDLTLLTDLYQLTMMNGYLKNGKDKDVAVFDLFFRRNNVITYSVAAGLEQAVEYIQNIRFTESDIKYLRSLGLFDEAFLEYLKDFRFTGDVYAVPEGTLVFPEEPLLTVRAPLCEAQLLETALLNIVNHQTLIATKSAKVAYAAKGDTVMEFGLRRAQGPDAGVYGARASVIGGCTSTSDVLAGKLFGIPVAGTHAHSWVMNFPTEYEAFLAYAELFPDACLLLVDTYDTLRSGVPNAIKVFDILRSKGHEPKGIRLDSGDLAYLSKQARKMLDDAGYPDAIICASGDLDEYLITSLKNQGAKIDLWGVGTKLITSADMPALGGVHALLKSFESVGRQYVHGFLGYHSSAVELARDEVHAASAARLPRLERAPYGVLALVRRQKARVQIYHFPLKLPHYRIGKNPHKARQYHEIRANFPHGFDIRRLAFARQARPVPAGVDEARGHGEFARR